MTPDAVFDPSAFASGLIDVGLLRLPIVPLALLALVIVAVLAAIGLLNRRREGERSRPLDSRRAWRVGWVAWFGPFMVLMTASTSFDPIEPGSVSGAGLGVAEVRSDGLTRQGSTSSWQEFWNSPHYVVRISPGEPYTVLASVRNSGPLPIRLLGWRKPEITYGSGSTALLDDYVIGLAVPREPTAPSAMPHEIVPFSPVEIAPGAEQAIVIVGVGGECADPTAPAPRQDPNHQIGRLYPFVFEVLGWRRVGDLWPQFELTVASRPGCERSPADTE